MSATPPVEQLMVELAEFFTVINRLKDSAVSQKKVRTREFGKIRVLTDEHVEDLESLCKRMKGFRDLLIQLDVLTSTDLQMDIAERWGLSPGRISQIKSRSST